jgi:hypothetical protein
MSTRTVQQVALRYARDLAGGVTFLARLIRIPTLNLDEMLHGREAIPNWVFLRVVDFINETEAKGAKPPGLPDNWRDLPQSQEPE